MYRFCLRTFSRAVAGFAALIVLAAAGVIPLTANAQNSPNITDPFTILTYKDLAGSCVPQQADAGATNVAGCCAAPGRRNCSGNGANGYVLPACLTLDSTLVPDPYGAGTLCTLSPVTVDTALNGLGQTGTDMTFYITSDIHYFRRTYNLTDQLTHVQVLNNFYQTGTKWPSGSGIPANTPTASPLAIVIDGDITTHGLAQDLGAFRMNYERGTVPASIQYPVLFGLGNHETVSDETPENAQRMFSYEQARMANTHIDPQSGNYSWDWQGIHFVQLNTWAGDKTSVYLHSSDGLGWLANDLQTYVGNSTKPVMLFQHYLFPDVQPTLVITTANDDVFPTDGNAIDAAGNKTGQGYESFYNVVQNYNIVGMFGGHDHCLGISSSILPSLPVTGTVYPGVAGYGVPIDDFDDGSGGDTHGTNGAEAAGIGNPCGATVVDGQTITQTAVASFLVVHANQQYLDVGAVSWTGVGSTPYFDKAEGLPAAAAACRKRINSQFIPAPSAIKVTATSTGYSVISSAAMPADIPVALKFGSRSGVGGFNFVDNCGDPGDKGKNNLYFLINGEGSLAINTTYPVAATQSGTTSVNPSVVVLTPLSGASPASFQHTVNAGAPANDAFTVYGPPNTQFTSQVLYSGTASGWMTLTPSSGTYSQLGTATFAIQYAVPANGFGMSMANVQVISTATSVIQNVQVSVTEQSISLALISPTAYPGEVVTLTATVSPAQTAATINFTSGTSMLGVAQTDTAGIATFPFTTNSIGTIPLTASFSGESATQTLTVGPPVTVSVSPNPVMIMPGQSGTVAVSVVSFAGFAGIATVVCSVPVKYMTCTPASSVLTIKSGMSGSLLATITVAATTSSVHAESHSGIMLAGLMGVLGLAEVFSVTTGCGSGIAPSIGSDANLPAGSQLVTFSTTAAGSVQTTNVTVDF
jgi:hypothetical protein